MDDLGEYRRCSPSLRDLEGVARFHGGNQTLNYYGGDSWSMSSFFFGEGEEQFVGVFFLNVSVANRTFPCGEAFLRALKILSKVNLNDALRGVSSSRKEDADKKRNLQPGGRAACFSFC